MGVLFTILLIILFIYYVLPRILPWLIAFLGNKMLNRFRKNMEEGQQTFGGQTNRQESGGYDRSERSRRGGRSNAGHGQIIGDDEGEYVDFEEVPKK